DKMLSGGFVQGSANLVRGAPGTGKTVLALQYLLHGAEHGEPGMLISFEEFPQSLQNDAQSLGWDLHTWQERGLLHLYFTSPQVLLKSLEAPAGPLSDLFIEKNIKRVVLDSVTHFTRLTNEQLQLRYIYNRLINALKREGVTALLLAEEGSMEAQRTERGALSFVVDTIMLLRYVEVESAIQRAITVMKMRSSDHIKEIRRYEIRQGGLAVTGPFEGRESILTGISHRVSR
ncbi:MAG TPA: ATPase domain-containing protein, partial [Anaerolineae bacterium]|nr:ATPase domain-containing protein [Anaerolineae bacterium]